MRPLTRKVTDLQCVRLDQRSAGPGVPVRQCLIVLLRLVFAAVFEADDRVFAERHQVRQQETIRGVDFVLLALCRLQSRRAHWMAGERQGHVPTAPVITAAAPFLRARALGLRRKAVVEEEARVSLERSKFIAMSENE